MQSRLIPPLAEIMVNTLNALDLAELRLFLGRVTLMYEFTNSTYTLFKTAHKLNQKNKTTCE